MEFDLDSILAAQEQQAQNKASNRAQPLRSVLKFPIRHARGGHSQDAQRRAKKGHDWMLEKIHAAENKRFWEEAEKRVGGK